VARVLRFADYVLDVMGGCLRAADREIQLRPKSYDVLRYLTERAGQLVTKDELLAAVWPGLTVTEESLAQCVSEIRRALGDRDQTIIKTVPRRGYRFVASVVKPDADAPVFGPAAVRSAAAETTDAPTSDRPSVAVLPFSNIGGDPQQEYLSDGISEDIITELSRFSELRVISRNSSFRYKGNTVDVRQIGGELGARYLVEGGVQRAGDRVRISAQLIDCATRGHLWAERYDRQLEDLFAVQDEVARAIVAALAAHVTKAEAERVLLKPPARWEAYDYVLRAAGVYPVRQQIGVGEARRLLERSLTLDPNYARAYTLLSWTYAYAYLEPIDHEYLSAAALERAYDLAKRAVQLDPLLPHARAQLGWVLLFKGEHEDSLAEFAQASTLNPNYVDHRLALALAYAGDPQRAIDVLRANAERDPFHPFIGFAFLGHAQYMLCQYREAAVTLRRSITRAPNIRILPLWLSAACARLGHIAEARVQAAEVLRLEPEFTISRWKRTAPYRYPEHAEHLFEALRKAGLPDRDRGDP
jgi:adenylate cyclase